MEKYINLNKILWLFVIALLFSGCEDDDDATLPNLVASFAHTIEGDIGKVSFLNLSENAESYSWNFGDGSSSTLINPIKTYTTGTYTAVLTAKDAFGRTRTFEDVININIPLPITFPVNFDGANVNYAVTTFNGATFEIVDNPDPSGSNPNVSKVGAITNSGTSWEGIFFDLGTALDLSEQKSVKINFWSNTPLDILLKLEQGTSGDVETTASHGGSGWEEVYFTFDASASYSRITLFVDGPGTTAGTFYFDDVSQLATEDIPCLETQLELPIDFDCNGIAYTDKIVGNVSFAVVDNPELSGINSEPSKVGQINNVGANWENAFFNLDTPVDFTTDKGIKLKLFSNQALPVLLKFEDGTGADTENVQNHGGTGWEELTFTLNSSDSYNDMVIFIDGPGTAAGTFYIDDIEQVFINTGGGGGTFDSGLLTNGDFENGGTAWSGNALNVQTEGGNSFNLADVTAAGNPFDVNLSQIVEIVQGKNYTLSFEASSDRNRTILAGIGLNEAPWTAATETVNLTADTQTFTLQLSSADFGIANSRVLFDMGAEIGVVVIDNVSLVCTDCDGGSGGGGGSGSDIISEAFSDATSIDTWERLADANTSEASIAWIADGGVEGGAMQISGSNPSDAAGKAYIFQKTFTGLNFNSATNVRLTFDLKLAAPLTAAAVHLQTNIPGVGVTNNFDVQTGGLNESTWTSYSFDFSGVDGAADNFTMHLNFASGAVVNAGGVLLVDNIRLVAN